MRTTSARRMLDAGVRSVPLLLAMVAGCGGGDTVSEYDRIRQSQENAAAALRQAGGEVTEKRYSIRGYEGDAWIVKLRGVTITDETIAHMKALGRVAELDLSKSTITDDQLGQLNEFGNLFMNLDLSNTNITDAGLAKLTNLYVLFDLNLTGTKVTRAGVDRFLHSRQENSQVLVKKPKVRL